MRLEPDGGLTASNVPLVDLLRLAHGYPAHRIDGLSGWALTERFDVVARGTTAPGAPFAGVERTALSVPGPAGRAVPTETRQAPVYELRLDRADGRLGPSEEQAGALLG